MQSTASDVTEAGMSNGGCSSDPNRGIMRKQEPHIEIEQRFSVEELEEFGTVAATARNRESVGKGATASAPLGSEKRQIPEDVWRQLQLKGSRDSSVNNPCSLRATREDDEEGHHRDDQLGFDCVSPSLKGEKSSKSKFSRFCSVM
eukprot:gnl/MRDRNA2_/MRDRNA2_245738_c0_seq1.p1 gnl/MRDRNA2_/MRDRNA2_245738_c0~~gnl/MRDRNA2_/MRDRNA2_245738_c0_seq1.p1  ORF type:complete len:146 (+),score=31.20 gnl/MRDRNA2_/MRDRNA2_245738_c0_seq1:2-439(+)